MSDLGQRSVLHANNSPETKKHLARQQDAPGYLQSHFWADGMLRVGGRELNGVQASPCYQGGHFACVTCHETHVPPARPAAWSRQSRPSSDPEAKTAAACLQCHAKIRSDVPAHTHHAAESPGSVCANCHLPHVAAGVLRAVRSHQVASPSVRESVATGRPNACNLCHLDRTLAWTAAQLAVWYGQKAPELSADERQVSTGVLWLMKGDAQQRALVAWSMGWAPAQRAAGRDWFHPFLFVGMQDPYAAVRYISWQSLQTLPGLAGFEFDFTDESPDLNRTVGAGYQQWLKGLKPGTQVFPEETGLQPDGRFRAESFQRLLLQRDQFPLLQVE